jgi:mono/diheme cytochrome c family protein
MKKALKIIRYILIIIVVGVAGLLGYVKFCLPSVGAAPEIKVESTPEAVKRGEYLANHVCVCVDCHSRRDWTMYAGPITPGTTGQGGELFDQDLGFPGSFTSKNITPYHLANWTDGEIYRLITTGVNKDGKAIFPVMPYPLYGKMDPSDVKAIIAYIRTLQPIKKNVPDSKLDFPMSIIVNTIPQKADPHPIPPKSDQVAYGQYIATAAACQECHTKQVKGQVVGELFAGGFEFKMPFGTLRSANITPDKQTGIGTWTKEMFIKRFKIYTDTGYHLPSVLPGQMNTIMPWNMYCGMDTADLGALFTYLQTIKPVSNTVVRFSPGMASASK